LIAVSTKQNLNKKKLIKKSESLKNFYVFFYLDSEFLETWKQLLKKIGGGIACP